MNLKGHIQVLVEEKKRVDEPIASDLRTYARLTAEINQKSDKYAEDRQQLKDLESFFANFAADAALVGESDQIKNLKQEMEDLERQMNGLRNEIGNKKEYYEALSKSDYKSLVSLGTDESCMAAIERFYASTIQAASVSRRIELARSIESYLKKSKFADKVFGSLMCNYLIYCEQHGYPGSSEVASEREVYDALIRQYASQVSSQLWKSIELVYESYEVQSLLQRCVNEVEEFRRMSSSGSSVEESFDQICDLVETQMKTMFPALKGIQMTLKAEKIRFWYKRSFVKVDGLLKKWEVQNRTFKKEYDHLKKVESELRKGMEDGLTKNECQKFAQTLERIAKAKDSFVSVSDISSAVREMSNEFEALISEVTELKNISVRNRRRA